MSVSIVWPLWLLVISLLVSACIYAYKLLRAEIDSKKSNSLLFEHTYTLEDTSTHKHKDEEEDDEIDVIKKLDLSREEQVHAYDRLRKTTFEAYLETLEDQSMRELEGEYDDLADIDMTEALKDTEAQADSWQRRLPPNLKASLKSALLRRSMLVLPRCDLLSHAYTTKRRLYDKGLLSEAHWLEFDQAQEKVLKELAYVRFEAECLQEGWGLTDSVFETAMKLFRHNKMKEAEKKEEEKRKQQELHDKKELARQRKLAEKMMQALIEKDEAQESKKQAAKSKRPQATQA